jgi:hypothetical protein
MPETYRLLSLAGLALGAFGAFLLAFDVVWGPGKRWKAASLKNQLETLRSTRKFVRDATTNLPHPPWTEAEIERLLQQEEDEWGAKERALATQSANFLPRYEGRVVTMGAVGIILIGVSFILQFFGSWLAP